MASRLEEIYTKQRNERLGITLEQLQYDRVQNPAQLIQDTKQTENRLRETALDRYEKIFNLRGLDCEGTLGDKLKATNEETLANLSIDAEKARLKVNGATLKTCTATAPNGSKCRWWYEIAM
jgi:hypothetical protein